MPRLFVFHRENNALKVLDLFEARKLLVDAHDVDPVNEPVTSNTVLRSLLQHGALVPSLENAGEELTNASAIFHTFGSHRHSPDHYHESSPRFFLQKEPLDMSVHSVPTHLGLFWLS